MFSKLLTLLLSGIFFLTSVILVHAASISITSSPTTIEELQEFNVGFSASSLDPDTQYYIKVRVGTNNSYTKAETKNNGSWFGDTDGWESFPIQTTGASGALVGTVTARVKNTADAGANNLYVRLRKVGSSSNVSPDGESTIQVTDAPTPTPTPSPVPTNTNTPTPTKTPTNTPIPTKSNTPTPSKKLTTTPTSTEINSTSLGDDNTPTPEIILGAHTVSENQPEGELIEENKNSLSLGKSFIAGGFALVGLTFIGLSGYSLLKGRSGRVSKNSDTMEIHEDS